MMNRFENEMEESLMDNFNTRQCLKLLGDMITEGYKYLNNNNNNNNNNNISMTLLNRTLVIVRNTCNTLGIHFQEHIFFNEKEGQFQQQQQQQHQQQQLEEDPNDMIKMMCEYRSEIRNFSINGMKENKDNKESKIIYGKLLTICDSIREDLNAH